MTIFHNTKLAMPASKSHNFYWSVVLLVSIYLVDGMIFSSSSRAD